MILSCNSIYDEASSFLT